CPRRPCPRPTRALKQCMPTQLEAIPPSQRNRDVPQWKLRPHGRDTGEDPPLLRSCGDPWMARQLCRRDPRSLARGCQGENSVKIIPIKVSAWIRSAWRELGTPARVLAGVERIRERIVEHSEASELFRSQLALRRPTSTTRMTPKRVRLFYRRILTGTET